MNELTHYANLLQAIKQRIGEAQTRAMLSVNAELIRLYWDIGQLVTQRQDQEGWSAGVIPKLALDLKNELPEVKGFSERNLGRMVAFFRAYPDPESFLPQAVAKIELDAEALHNAPESASANLLWHIPWGHHALLIEKVKNLSTRRWYMQQTLAQGWSRSTLATMINSRLHERQGQSTNNFATQLPAPQSDLAQQTLRDPYLFDFLTLEEPFHERELEAALIRHLEKFLIELGQGFAFVGRQYLVSIGEDDFYIDLLFYHLRLRCFIVIDLKRGKFKPEYAGKINFYCNIVDDHLRHASDQLTIGLILCQEKNAVVAEYALRGMNKPIGVSEYELTRALPDELKSSLPTIEELEAELSGPDAATTATGAEEIDQ
ncbi:MAG: PDDEXK nuclease domain-containing protein [Caldilineaceae bacterium]